MLGACLLAAACGSSTAPGDGPLVLEPVTGDNQTGTVAAALPAPLVVRALDQEGAFPVAGATIRFTVETGGGSVSESTVTTDGEGRAAVTWTLGTTAGDGHRVRATWSDGARTASVPFEATALAGTAASMELLSGNLQLGQRGAELPFPLVVRVSDEFGNAVAGETVTYAVLEGDGSVGPAEAVTDTQGRASTRWTLGEVLGEQGVAAASGALPTVSFAATALELPYVGSVVESVFSGSQEALTPDIESPGIDDLAPSVTVTGSENIVPGGGAMFTVTADRAFPVLYAFVGEHAGHFRLPLPAPTVDEEAGTVSYELVLLLETVLPEDQYRFGFAAGSDVGAGPVEDVVVEVHQVQTGPIQVSVAWDTSSDVDLLVVEPSGEVIFHENPVSGTGGTLDLDANGACEGDDIRNENISWADVAPRGTYVVRVNLWGRCQQPITNWLVTVRVEGRSVQTFRGRFTQDGTPDGEGEFVTTFVY